jgi:Flp pilus assembly pilin Flp
MRFPENESGATRTEYSLIAAGISFAATLAALSPSMTLARPIAALVLLVAWGAAMRWLG